MTFLFQEVITLEIKFSVRREWCWWLGSISARSLLLSAVNLIVVQFFAEKLSNSISIAFFLERVVNCFSYFVKAMEKEHLIIQVAQWIFWLKFHLPLQKLVLFLTTWDAF